MDKTIKVTKETHKKIIKIGKMEDRNIKAVVKIAVDEYDRKER